MNKILVAFAVVVFMCGGVVAKENKVTQLTEKQVFTQKIKALAEKRQQYLSTVKQINQKYAKAIKQIELEMIKLQAVLSYIETKEITVEK